MITFDTKVLVRLLVEDEPEQVEKARGVLRECFEAGTPCLITITVLCELIWVLKRSYRVPREELVEVVRSFLDDERYAVEHHDAVETALAQFRQGKADFTDYLIGARGQALGSDVVVTFDRGLGGESGFRLL